MSLYGLLSVVVVMLTLLVALVLALRFMRSLHLVTAQAEDLRAYIDAGLKARGIEIVELAKDVSDEKSKLVMLSNRIR